MFPYPLESLLLCNAVLTPKLRSTLLRISQGLDDLTKAAAPMSSGTSSSNLGEVAAAAMGVAITTGMSALTLTSSTGSAASNPAFGLRVSRVWATRGLRYSSLRASAPLIQQ